VANGAKGAANVPDSPDGDRTADLSEVIPRAYEELRRVARARVAQLQSGGTLAPTELVNEVLLRLLRSGDELAPRQFHGAGHLIRVASIAMHGILVDHARRRDAIKRGGQRKRVDLDDDLPIVAPARDMLGLDDALQRLRATSEEHFELVMLRMYGGLSLEQIAQQRGVSRRTLERQWSYVKAVLHRELNEELTHPSDLEREEREEREE
jgi:RNA polymerase sigma factor (TIGR02999 family)